MHLPPDVRTSGMGLLTTATSLTRLLASVVFGALWTWAGVETAVLVYLVGLVVALLVTLVLFGRTALEPVAVAA